MRVAATRRLVFERDCARPACGCPWAYGASEGRRADETEVGDGATRSRDGSLESADRVTGSELLVKSGNAPRQSGDAESGDTDLCVP